MKKIIIASSLLTVIILSINNNTNAGLFGTRGKKALRMDGTACCRYALFNSNCTPDYWLGDCNS